MQKFMQKSVQEKSKNEIETWEKTQHQPQTSGQGEWDKATRCGSSAARRLKSLIIASNALAMPCRRATCHTHTQKKSKKEKRVEKRSKMAGKKCKNAQRSAVANGRGQGSQRGGVGSRAEVQPAGRGRTAAAATPPPPPPPSLSALQ